MKSMIKITLAVAILMFSGMTVYANEQMPVTGCTFGPWAGPAFSPDAALAAMTSQAEQQCAPKVAKQASPATVFHVNNDEVRPFCAMAQFTCY